MARGRESLPLQPNRPRRRCSSSSGVAQDILLPPVTAPAELSNQADHSNAAPCRSRDTCEAAPSYDEEPVQSPRNPPYSQPPGSNSILPRQPQISLSNSVYGVEDPIQQHQSYEQEQLERALAYSRDEERRIREQRERDRHAQEEEELARVLQQTRAAETENVRRRENDEIQQIAREEEELTRVLRESAETERRRLEQDRRLIEERERAFGGGRSTDTTRTAEPAGLRPELRSMAQTGHVSTSSSAAQTEISPSNVSFERRQQTERAARAERTTTCPSLEEQASIRESPQDGRSDTAEPTLTRFRVQESGQLSAPLENQPPSHSPLANPPSYPLRAQPNSRGQNQESQVVTSPTYSLGMALPQPRERIQVRPTQRPTNRRRSTRNASDREYSGPFRVPTGDLERATQDSLQQRALQILATAEEGSPAYIRAMTAFETPAAAIDAEDGLPEHLAPPAYEEIAHDEVVNHMEWTTDGKGDEPGRKRRLTERDWRRMEMWKEILEKEKAGETEDAKDGKSTNESIQDVLEQQDPGAGIGSSSRAERSSGTIVELLDRSSTIAAAARTSQVQLTPTRRIRASALRDRVEGAQRRDNQRFNLRFSRISGREQRT